MSKFSIPYTSSYFTPPTPMLLVEAIPSFLQERDNIYEFETHNCYLSSISLNNSAWKFMHNISTQELVHLHNGDMILIKMAKRKFLNIGKNSYKNNQILKRSKNTKLGK